MFSGNTTKQMMKYLKDIISCLQWERKSKKRSHEIERNIHRWSTVQDEASVTRRCADIFRTVTNTQLMCDNEGQMGQAERGVNAKAEEMREMPDEQIKIFW